MRELFERLVFGVIFLGVVFIPFYADIQNDTHLFIFTLFLFSLFGVNETLTMSVKINPVAKSVKISAFILCLTMYLPFILLALQSFIPELIKQNLFFEFLKENNWLLLGIWFITLFLVVFFSIQVFVKEEVKFLLGKPLLLCFMYPILLFWIFASFYSFAVPENKILVLLILAPIYLNDSFAYICGRIFGKTKLLPKVSPKKTVEGFVGGIILASTCMCIFLYTIDDFKTKNVLLVILISLFASILSTLGDLFESKLKRSAGVKDSGKILPGHGGILDRVDAMLFVTPVLSIILLLL